MKCTTPVLVVTMADEGGSGTKKKTIVLFDVDGTLTVPRQTASESMLEFLQELRKYVTVGIVGGSDLGKICEQLGGAGATSAYDYMFAENGLLALKAGEEIGRQSLKLHLGEEKLTRFLNFTLRYLAGIEGLPCKRGTFIEFRNGMLNVSPIGRNCSQEERDEFERFDKVHGIRKAMVSALQAEFEDLELTYSIGGQISFDVRIDTRAHLSS